MKKVFLELEDGTIYEGKSFGAEKEIAGEVVFNTGMVGYPETLTDPSYNGQIIVFTYPLIGNYGIPPRVIENGILKNFEADKIWAKGIVVANYSENYSHFDAEKSLSEWLIENNTPGITDIDTRALTKKLRIRGSMLGRIYFEKERKPDFWDPNKINLVAEASTKEIKVYGRGEKKIALIDCGTKNNIIRAFVNRGIQTIRVPYNYDFSEMDINGALISNGPGDPSILERTIFNIRKAMNKNLPMLGICLGCQLLALSAGGKTYKLKYGHRGHNQPVNELGTRRCYITSQNHGYAIDSKTLPEDWKEWFINDNDETNEGILHIIKPFYGAQFHPEASPGPDDAEFIFDMFTRALL